MNSYSALCHSLAEKYMVSPGQIHRYGVGRFMAMSEDARLIVAGEMQRYKQKMEAAKVQ